MKRINVGISMGLRGCQIEDVIEVEDDATEEEIEAEARKWAFGQIDWWFDISRRYIGGLKPLRSNREVGSERD